MLLARAVDRSLRHAIRDRSPPVPNSFWCSSAKTAKNGPMNLESPVAHVPALASTPLASGSREARKRLRHNRILATTMLAGMGVVFVATRMVPEPGFVTLLIQSGAEAGMVGGLADWFAVTALFRHPLGLPIPHTAIIPNNKDRSGRNLGHFVETNFLTADVLLPKLRQMQLGQRIAAWLAAPATAP